MKRLLLALLLVLSLPATAYDIPSHVELARRTVELATSGGREYRDLDLHQAPILKGVAEEDTDTPYPRFLHHFYDPDTGLGMPENTYSIVFGGVRGAQFLQRSGRYLSALQWGLEDMPDPLDWRASIEAYDDTDEARERAYEGLGHVLHLLEDMAQPDHARCRPHPGNYLQDHEALLDRLAPELAQQVRTHVGYERLWHEITDWPRGERVHPQTSLKDAFDVMAFVSHKTEDDQGLPNRDKKENALGLGPLKVSANLSKIAREQVPGGSGFAVGLAMEALHDNLTAAGMLAFRDNLWVGYEMNVPLVPTIPWPQRDAYTEKHVKMGEHLLKLAEEHGAGLLRLYHDIVNPPAYVESVEILQGGQSKYRADWQPAAPDQNGHIASRSLRPVRDEMLKQGDLNEIRIRFGPTYKHGAENIREAVGDVQVWAEGPSGTRTSVALAGFTPDPEAAGADMLVGTFTASEGGTLHITGHDLDDHFPRPGGPTGEELDSNPATCARATWGSSADGAPYPFTGYESGADTNHAFKIEGECVTGPIRADLVNSYRWGTWRGTIHWGRPANGPRPGRVDVTTAVSLRAALSLPGSAGAVRTELQGGFDPVAIIPNSHTVVGRVQGTFRVEASGVLSDWATTGTVVDAGGKVDLRPGSPEERCEYLWSVRYNDDPNLKVSNVETVGGETCVDGNMAGRTQQSTEEKSWSFHFTPGEPPPHVPMLLKHIAESAPVFEASGHFGGMIAGMLTPVYQARPAAAQAYTPSLMQIGELTSKMRAFDGLPEAYDEQFSAACEAWLSSAPDAEARYQQSLEGFRQAYEQYRQHLHGQEAELAGLVEALAGQVQGTTPAVAQKLRQASQKLRQKGLGAFGVK